MDIELRDYQKQCLSRISELLSIGKKHFSIAMTVGLGSKWVALFLVEKLVYEKQGRVAVVFKNSILKTQFESMSQMHRIRNPFSALTVSSFSDYDKINDYNYVVLCDLDVHTRKQMFGYLQKREVTSFSLFTLGLNYANSDFYDISKMAENVLPIVRIYITDKNIDIRDVKYSDEEESALVYSSIVESSKELLRERETTDQEIIEAQKRNEYLQELIQSHEKDRQIDELRLKLDESQKELAAAKIQMALQDQMNAFLQDLLSRFGIGVDAISHAFEQIQKVRFSLQNDLNSDNSNVREQALKRLQDSVSGKINEIMQDKISSNDRQYYTEYLVGELTENVWQRLSDDSKAFLITAKVTYESMIKMKDKDSFDYSGVCLLITKALEVETTKRFFTGYKDYLRKKYWSVSCWPYALRKRDNNGEYTENEIQEGEFTLGSVVSIFGLKRTIDDFGSITGFEVARPKPRNDFIDYARSVLFRFSDRQRVAAEIDKDCRFIEKVRLDYRNPAAHRDRLSITSAKECMEYVIDVQHMLKEMLYVMKI